MNLLNANQRRILRAAGFPAPKWIQEQVITSLLKKHDTLALLPTGMGKSLCYQAAGVLLQKPSIVISPLLALMQDQLLSLQRLGLNARHWSSLSSKEEERHIQKEIASGNIDFLYVSPEKLQQSTVLECLQKCRWGVITVDEAHCVETWGESFRPLYRSLGPSLQKLKQIGNFPIFACTASATTETQQIILSSLGMKNPNILGTPNLRPNLSLAIIQPPSNSAKKMALFRCVQQWWETGTGSALIYVSSRSRTEELANWLRKCGLPAEHFHAGLTRREKNSKLNHFCSQKRSLFVCTCALGMGVDQPNVRLVIHEETPLDMESYVQEVGRAGRDGLPASAICFHQKDNFQKALQYREAKTPTSLKKTRKQALEIQSLAENHSCISREIQHYFASSVIPDSNIFECKCNRCHPRGWLLSPRSENFRCA